MDRIVPMEEQYAGQIATWTYDGEYGIYDFANDEEALNELMDGSYYACIAEDGELKGYYCYGESAKIRTAKPDAYKEGPVDIGLGLRPDLCGQGLGRKFVRAGIAFAETKFNKTQIRLAVATFNKRAIRAYEGVGFQRIKTLQQEKTGRPFYMMVCVL